MHSRLQAPEAEEAHMTPEEIFSLVRRDLMLVEEEFDRNASDASNLVSEIARYLHEGGGKRVRPTLLLLSSRLISDQPSPSSIRMAAVMEMLRRLDGYTVGHGPRALNKDADRLSNVAIDGVSQA